MIEDYEHSQMLLQKIIEKGQTIKWQRAVIYAQNRLADIAIAQGNLAQADSLLRTGLPVSERNRDKRRIALYKHSYARLALAKGDNSEARRWALEAIDDFERLGIQPELIEMRRMVEMMDG